MIRYAQLICAVTLLACGGGPAVEAPPDPVPSDERGPYEVSATTFRDWDARGKYLIVEAWYPATPAEDAELLPYEGVGTRPKVTRDQPADLRGAPYPVVAFSHGYAGIRYQSDFLVQHLVSHGMVVIAVDHTNNTLLDLDEDVTATVAAERPRDVSEAVDLAAGLLSDGLIAPDDGMAMMGHSFGGWTTLVVGGGQIDREHLLAYCEEFDARGCRFFEAADALALDDLSQAVPDPRAEVAVAMSPGLAYSFGPDGVGLQGNVPTLVLGGTSDEDIPYDTEIVPVYEALGPGSALGSLVGAGHFAFSDLCELLPLPECDGAAAGWMDVPRAHEITRVVATAWVRARWLGEADEEVFLTPDFVGAAGDATWESR